jgi:DNA invertase Pin-like site-specific DNA recombinase
MEMSEAAAAAAVEQHQCPMCSAPAGSPCRTRGGKVAPKYHTQRFAAVPQLRADLEVRTPADRRPGRTWQALPAPEPAPAPAAEGIVKIGYARCSSATQELQSQLDALEEAGCRPIFSEKISTRIKVRPKLEAAVEFALTVKAAAPGQDVVLCVHEIKRLGRGSAELTATAERLRREGIGLEMLTGPIQGRYDPSGYGGALFAFFAGMAEADREYIREKTLEGQETARSNGRHGGRPNVIDDNMAAYARALRDQDVPVAEIRTKLVIPEGKNKGQHPSLASVYRVLAEDAPAQDEPSTS